MEEAEELSRAMAELTVEMKQRRTDGAVFQAILEELRNSAKEQSGALAIIASRVLDNKKKRTIKTKPSLALLSLLKRSRPTMRLSNRLY